MPEFTVDGSKDSSIYLKKYIVNVKVTGNMAYTSIEMQFCNRSRRVLEAELAFTLPDGVNVSNYALDINGKLREAVPVEKEKGTQVFESIEVKKVDPGLLEKTAGNTFRTRIYPVTAMGCRTIRIGYTQELIFSASNALTYNLPLAFDQPVEQFSVDFKVFSKTNPEIAADCNTGMQFTKAEEVYNSHVEKRNFTPNGNFTMIIPKMGGANEVQMQTSSGRNYFLLNSYLKPKERPRNIGDNIAILWDASFSGRLRNHEKEMELLDSVLQYKKTATVQLFIVIDEVKKINAFSIVNGNTEELKKALKQVIYDGACELHRINTASINATEIYLFSDGVSSFSDAEPRFGKQPVFCINAGVNSDYQRLQNWSNKTGGQYINLNESYIADAVHSIKSQVYQLINIKGNIADIYPALPVKASTNICLAGISGSTMQELTLQFGYGNEITEERKITLNASIQSTNDLDIERAWAQKKISFLESSGTNNKADIIALGKKYGIVTEGTSLIVLELVSDYVRNKIEPPAELRAEYDFLMKQNNLNNIEQRNSILANAIRSAGELKAWGEEKPAVKSKAVARPAKAVAVANSIRRRLRPQTTNNSNNNQGPRSVPIRRDTSGVSRIVSGKVTDETGNPIAFASVKIKGSRSGVAATANGEYTIRAYAKDVLEISGASFTTRDVSVGDRSFINSSLEKAATSTISEVVVTAAFNTRRVQRSVASNAQVVSAEEVNTIRQTNLNNALAGKVAGAQVRTQSASLDRQTNVRVRGAGNLGSSSGAIYVIDGVITSNSNDVSPDDIEDVTVLQGPSATALFGQRAADGAIVITTKGGRRLATNQPGLTDSITSGPKMQIKTWTPERDYLKQMEQTTSAGYYAKYLELREQYIGVPTFYFDMANFFFDKKDQRTGLKILYNLAELNFESAELFKMLGYKLKEQGQYEKEAYVFRKVLQWRPHEPQSYRDYALALADGGKYQQALDTLYQALNHLYESRIMSAYFGIEELIVTEMNQLIRKYKLNTAKLDKALLVDNPVDVRVVLNWNMNDTDIDLWVTDANGEKCFYGHKTTAMGGRISDDFTQGYGPEQFLLKKASKGTYKIEINYYGDDMKKVAGPATIMAEVYMHYGTVNETKKIITIQMKGKGNGAFFVGDIQF